MMRLRIGSVVLFSWAAGAAFALPSVNLIDYGNGSAGVQIVSDQPGSLAVELAVQAIGDYRLTGAAVNTDVFDTPNPGDSPFVDGSPVTGDAFGLVFEEEENRLFVAYGAGVVEAGVYELLSFTYDTDIFPLGCGTHLIEVFGLVAQGGASYTGLSDSTGVVVDCFSDFDGDGAVGDGDLTLLLSNWGRPVPPVPAGWNGAQPTAPNVGDDELTSLLSAWGQGARAVPEPTCAALAAITLLLPPPRNRRHDNA